MFCFVLVLVLALFLFLVHLAVFQPKLLLITKREKESPQFSVISSPYIVVIVSSFHQVS